MYTATTSEFDFSTLETKSLVVKHNDRSKIEGLKRAWFTNHITDWLTCSTGRDQDVTGKINFALAIYDDFLTTRIPKSYRFLYENNNFVEIDNRDGQDELMLYHESGIIKMRISKNRMVFLNNDKERGYIDTFAIGMD